MVACRPTSLQFLSPCQDNERHREIFPVPAHCWLVKRESSIVDQTSGPSKVDLVSLRSRSTNVCPLVECVCIDPLVIVVGQTIFRLPFDRSCVQVFTTRPGQAQNENLEIPQLNRIVDIL